MIVKTATGLIAWYIRAMGRRSWTSFWSVIYVLPGSEHDGRILLSIKYLWWLCRYGYWNHPDEVEARAAEHGK